MAGPIAIIPARGGSKRFPRKNVATLAERPLVAHAIEAAQKSNVFERVIVSSEDPEILAVAEEYGADEARPRPERLAGDRIRVADVCIHILSELEAEEQVPSSFGVLLPTNPLRTASDVRAAHKKFEQEGSDFLMSVVPYRHPPQAALTIRGARIEPFLPPEYLEKQSQDLETLYRHDGSIVFARTEPFREIEDFYGEDTAAYISPVDRSVDIDQPIALAWAEFLLSEGA